MPQNKSLNDLTLDELLQKATAAQDHLKSIQNKLADVVVTGVTGNQEVQIKISGKYNAISTDISDSAYADKEKLEQLITSAINDAMRKLEEIVAE